MRRLLALAVFVLVLGGCTGRQLMLELHTTVLYDKPRIEEISYDVEDGRGDGGNVVVRVRMRGDAGLEATFDVSPGIVDHEPMRETADGSYEGRYAFPPGVVGGPYTVVGRLKHDQAGEVILNDSNPLIISLFR